MLARPDRNNHATELDAAIAAEVAAAKPARLSKAERVVTEIRGRLAEANEQVRAAIARRAYASAGPFADGGEVNKAQRAVEKIEAELKPARVELHAAREAAAPVIRAALDGRLAEIASDLVAAAESLAAPLAALAVIDAGFARMGLRLPRSGQAPDIGGLHRLAASIHRSAAE